MLFPFTFFSQSLSYAAESIVGNADLLKKVRMAKLVFPVAALISNLINLVLSLIPLALIVLVTGAPFHWTWIYLPIPLLTLALFTLGASFFFAAANVFYRDVSHILQIVLQLWLYATPILYDINIFPERYHWLFKLNPLIFVLNGFRLSVWAGELPQVQSIFASFVCALISLVVGFAIFRRYQNAFVFYV